MRCWQVPDGHQEFPGYLATCEFECLLEQLYPPVLIQGVMGFEPSRKSAVTVTHFTDDLCIDNRRVDFQAVANDRTVVKQPRPVLLAINGNLINIKTALCLAKPCPFFQYQLPIETGLVNFQ